MFPMSINSISVMYTSWMIPKEVDPIEPNLYKISFCLSFDPSAEEDVMARLSSIGVIKEILKIRLPPSPPAPFRAICLHSNQRPFLAHISDFLIFSHIIFVPHAPSTSMLV